MTRFQALIGAACAALFTLAPAQAQMSVTTFGATDAAACFQNASDDYNRDTGPCDAALRGSLMKSDRNKTLVNRGIIHNRNGALSEALEDFNAAIASNSGLAEAYVNRGNTYFIGGQNDAAISDYEQSLSLGVNKPWAAYYNLGLAYDAKQDAAKARASYEKALELNPSFTPAQTKLNERHQASG